jgi:hypothetical protein
MWIRGKSGRCSFSEFKWLQSNSEHNSPAWASNTWNYWNLRS